MDQTTGILYIVATPIGNLEDVTLRAIKILSDVDIILAEDTRVTTKLLNFLHSGNYSFVGEHRIDFPKQALLSYHQHSSDSRKMEILQNIIAGKNIALVTDAGTPGISDPGNELISFLLSRKPDIKIVPIPGSNAIAAALSVSGLNVNRFVFLGFLPKKGKTKLFSWLKTSESPFVFFESPFRILKTLAVLKNEFGADTEVFLARELTKMYESLYRGSIEEVTAQLLGHPLKGEIVVVVNPGLRKMIK